VNTHFRKAGVNRPIRENGGGHSWDGRKRQRGGSSSQKRSNSQRKIVRIRGKNHEKGKGYWVLTEKCQRAGHFEKRKPQKQRRRLKEREREREGPKKKLERCFVSRIKARPSYERPWRGKGGGGLCGRGRKEPAPRGGGAQVLERGIERGLNNQPRGPVRPTYPAAPQKKQGKGRS